MAFSRLPYDFEEALLEVKSWRASYKPPQKEWNDENVIAWCLERGIKAVEPVYTTQQRTWVGLTDEEIFEIHKQVDLMQYLTFGKAIEAKLKDKNL